MILAQIQLVPEQASTFASRVDLLYYFMVAVTAFFTLLIAVLVVAFAIRYRRRSGDKAPQAIHGNNALEITWTAIPLVLVMIMFFWGAKIFFDMKHVPRDAMEILVTGKQWMWKMQHPNGKREINELHVPVDQPVKITMTSEDVIHSFFVPAFRIKQDAVPGKYTQAWFEATKVGKYHLFCAEYCGTEHARMGGWIHVMPQAEYQAWVGGDVAAESPVAGGERLFARLGCVTCHSGAKGAQGPDLAGVFGSEQRLADGETVLADENYIRESILTPQRKLTEGYLGVMPSYKGIVNEQQLLADRGLHQVAGRRSDDGRAGMTKHTTTVETPEAAPTNYLNWATTVKSWLLTVDHKRIGIMYLCTILVFFILGGIAAAIFRIELMTPQGDVVNAETYNKLFTMHGVMMIFFFLIPSIPATLGNFLVPIMIGARDVAFPKLNLAELVHVPGRRAFCCDQPSPGRRGHRLDLLHALQQHLRELARDPGRHGGLHRGVCLHPDRAELHRHHPQDAGAGPDLVPAAPVHLGAVRHEPDHDPGYAGGGHHPGPDHGGARLGHRDL